MDMAATRAGPGIAFRLTFYIKTLYGHPGPNVAGPGTEGSALIQNEERIAGTALTASTASVPGVVHEAFWYKKPSESLDNSFFGDPKILKNQKFQHQILYL